MNQAFYLGSNVILLNIIFSLAYNLQTFEKSKQRQKQENNTHRRRRNSWKKKQTHNKKMEREERMWKMTLCLNQVIDREIHPPSWNPSPKETYGSSVTDFQQGQISSI